MAIAASARNQTDSNRALETTTPPLNPIAVNKSIVSPRYNGCRNFRSIFDSVAKTPNKKNSTASDNRFA